MSEKHNILITINYGTVFVVWNISFKVCNNDCIMHRFGKQAFSSIFTQLKKMNDTVNF